MKTVYKYQLMIQDETCIHMPVGAEILTVAEQFGVLCLWALVEPWGMPMERHLRIVGTGQEVNGIERAKHIGTVSMSDGFVWHVFEEVGGGS